MSNLRILRLSEIPEAIPQLADWHFQQWGWMNPNNTVETRVARFEQHLAAGIPTTFVATTDGMLAGSASLVHSDMETRPELTPWMASVFVRPKARRRGVASALVDRIVREAHEENIETLYLFTPDQMPLYASLGWKAIERVPYRGEIETIMSICPAARVTAVE